MLIGAFHGGYNAKVARDEPPKWKADTALDLLTRDSGGAHSFYGQAQAHGLEDGREAAKLGIALFG